jgi:hypothetical protein
VTVYNITAVESEIRFTGKTIRFESSPSGPDMVSILRGYDGGAGGNRTHAIFRNSLFAKIVLTFRGVAFAITSPLFESMNIVMAVGAERNQIFIRIIAKPAAEANVVNLKILRGSAMLAPPAITF